MSFRYYHSHWLYLSLIEIEYMQFINFLPSAGGRWLPDYILLVHPRIQHVKRVLSLRDHRFVTLTTVIVVVVV